MSCLIDGGTSSILLPFCSHSYPHRWVAKDHVLSHFGNYNDPEGTSFWACEIILRTLNFADPKMLYVLNLKQCHN